jgi:hypothetical protein
MLIGDAPPCKFENILNTRSSEFGLFPLPLLAGTLLVTYTYLLQLAEKAVMQLQSHGTIIVKYPGHMSQMLLIIMIEAFRGLLFVFAGELGRVSLSRSVRIHHSFPLHSSSYMLVSRSSAVK